jgi:predicted dehydrogenase
MNMDQVRVAFIGAGSLANKAHYPSLSRMPDVELAGICDLDETRLQATADRFSVPNRYLDYRVMLDEIRPDAVYAIMPPHQLFDVAMDVLGRGHHLFMEKPPGVTSLQAESMARLAEDNGLVTAVGFQRRYHPLAVACWERVLERGPAHQVVASFYKNMTPQDIHPYYRGAIDILRSDAIHALDGLRFYTGLSEASSVSSDVRMLDGWYAVTFNALICFENGATGVLLANWRTGARRLKFEFHSCGASAYVDADGDGSVWVDNQPEADFKADYESIVGGAEFYVNQGFLAENRAFVDAVKSGDPPHNSLSDAVKTMKLADRVYASAMPGNDGWGDRGS